MIRSFHNSMDVIKFLLLIIFFLLAGCSSGGSITSFYLLDPIHSDTATAQIRKNSTDLSINIISIRLPQYLERPQIVTRSKTNKLELAEYHQWGGNLKKNMSRVLARNMSNLLDTPNVFIFPDRSLAKPDFRVEFVVMKFERDPDQIVRLSIQWRLSRGEDRMPVVTKISDLSSNKVEAGQDIGQTVSEMSILMGELSGMIAKEILRLTNM